MNVSALISSLYVTVIAGQELEAKALEHHERRTAGRFCRKTLSVHAVKPQARGGISGAAESQLRPRQPDKLRPRYSSRAEAGGPL